MRGQILFVTFAALLLVLPMAMSSLNIRMIRRDTLQSGFVSWECQFHIEIYRNDSFEVTFPEHSQNWTISITSFDFLGKEYVERRPLLERRVLFPIGMGRHKVCIEFLAPSNSSFKEVAISSSFGINGFSTALSQEQWMLIAIISCVVYLVATLAMVEREKGIGAILARYRRLSSVVKEFRKEMTEKGLEINNVDRVFSLYSGLQEIHGLRTINMIDDFVNANDNKRKLGSVKETRAALIAHVMNDLAEEMKECSKKYKASIALSLEQTLYRNLISSAYQPRINSLLYLYKEAVFLHRIASNLEDTLANIQAESTYANFAKVGSSLAVTVSALMFLGYPPTDFLAMKLPLFFYMISNVSGFSVNLLFAGRRLKDGN